MNASIVSAVALLLALLPYANLSAAPVDPSDSMPAVICSADGPAPVEMISLAELDKLVSHAPNGEFPIDWVNVPPAPMVIRKGEDAATATYQEAIGYTFLIFSMKRPRLVCMDDGRLVLVATAWLRKFGDEVPIMITSDDLGKTWTQPREIPGHGTLVNLGGKKLAVFDSGKIIHSNDAGETWSDPKPFALPDGTPAWHHGSVLVEGNKVIAGCSADGYNTFLLHSNDSGRTFGNPIFLPKFRLESEQVALGHSEGSLTRAADGALVIALRTGSAPGSPNWPSGYNDHWRRIITARSTDNGNTWIDARYYFKTGKVHSDMQALPNGKLLLTYAVRMGELDGSVYHGIEAVLSHDHGKSWDWANRFYLFRWSMLQSMHSPQSTVLPDGRIMTVFLYHYHAPSGRNVLPKPIMIGLVDAIIWRAE